MLRRPARQAGIGGRGRRCRRCCCRRCRCCRPVGDLSPGDTVEFYATEFMFAPADFVAEPGTYSGVLINDGTIEHDLTFEGGEPIVAAAGESVEFEFTVPVEGVRYWCSIPGHEDAGTVGFVSTGSTPPAAASSGDDHVASAATPAVEANPDAAPTPDAIRIHRREAKVKE